MKKHVLFILIKISKCICCFKHTYIFFVWLTANSNSAWTCLTVRYLQGKSRKTSVWFFSNGVNPPWHNCLFLFFILRVTSLTNWPSLIYCAIRSNFRKWPCRTEHGLGPLGLHSASFRNSVVKDSKLKICYTVLNGRKNCINSDDGF